MDIHQTASLFRSIKSLSCDVYGVLTDGGLYYDEDGHEIRRFHVLDGLGIQNLMKRGFHVCIISRSATKAIYHRAKALGIQHCYLEVKDKMDTMRQLLKELNLNISEVGHIGYDLNELELLLAVGFPITVPKAVKEVKEIAKFITEKNGGEGAVREITDRIIASNKMIN